MHRALLALLVSALAATAALRPPAAFDVRRLAGAGAGLQARILRDVWGVPHVFGRTDADTAFGLAWAHAEDDFATIQGALLAARGKLASVYGRQAAPNDYLVHLLRVWDLVDAGYETQLAPETRAVCEAYAAGLNRYAARHPDEALPALYPVRGKDVIAGFVHKTPLFFGLERVLRRLLDPVAEPPAGPEPGSNAFAVAPSRSTDGWTRLAVNSHQPWEGPVAWYEVHLRSEEGWDAVGGLFPGAPVVLHGHNRRLGWAHTVNDPDLIDVYALEIDPGDPYRYRLDGEWRRLEARPAPIQVRLLGPLAWTFEREVLWSVHGPVLRTPRGAFAIRLAGHGDLRHVEQWLRMNKARDLGEWTEAMRLTAVPMFNTTFADGQGNVAYVYNARLPLRPEGHDWAGTVPGDTSATLWSRYLPFDRLPAVVSPPSGFVQNCNSTPYRTTVGPGNPRAEDFPAAFGIETRLTNRALRALELLGGDEAISREEFEAYKFDTAYSADSEPARLLRRLLDAPPPRDRLVLEALEHLRDWDLRADPDSPAAALALLALRPRDNNVPAPPDLDEAWTRLAQAARHLERRFGRLDPPWREVLRLRRGRVDLGLGGAPDVLRAIYASEAEDGRLVAHTGDSYVLLVEWDPEGRVHSRSIHPFGTATRDASSPHYADQAPLFASFALKPVWMDEAEIRANLEREYEVPGR